MFSIRKLLVAPPTYDELGGTVLRHAGFQTFRGHDSARGVVLPYKSDGVLVVPF